MPVQVLLSPEARADFEALPTSMKARVRTVFQRLADWPNVSGVKWLRGPLTGQGRIRAGDWRVLFRLVAPNVLVVRIRHRSEVYEE
jgi:mRNA-degrading endonuclease RelE of RelBE toxin-antitoxin system